MTSISPNRKFTPFVDDGTTTEYVTKSGEVAKVVLSSKPSRPSYTILRGFVKISASEWVPVAWQLDGTCSHTDYDLFDVPVKHTRWINIYHPADEGYLSKKEADNYSSSERFACIEVTFEEGEGL